MLVSAEDEVADSCSLPDLVLLIRSLMTDWMSWIVLADVVLVRVLEVSSNPQPPS